MQANPSHSQDFCAKCGAGTLDKCPKCNSLIRGHYHNRRVVAPYFPPAFCDKCGQPYPWTQAKIAAARAVIEEISELTTDQRLTLASSIDDIASETPRTELAVLRVKKILTAVSPLTGETIKKLVVAVASETAKKLLTGS